MLKRNTSIIVFIILIFISVRSDASSYIGFPGDTVRIKIYRIGSSNSYGPIIDIYKTDNTIKIVYSVFERVIKDSLAEEDFLNKLMVFMKLKKYDITDSIIEKYHEKYYVYNRDSLFLNKKTDADYFKLVDKFYSTTDEALENKNIYQSQVKYRTDIAIDGVTFFFKIISRAGIREVSAHSPISTSHPLLYELLTNTLNTYRNKKHNIFLNKKTWGY